MARAGQQGFRLPAYWTGLGSAALAGTVVTGLLYGWKQFALCGTIADLALIVLVMFNAGLILVFARLIAPALRDMFRAFGFPAETAEEATTRIFRHPFVPATGLLLAVVISRAAWLIDPWGGQEPFRTTLSAFLFAGNLLPGMGIAAILLYWLRVVRALPTLDFRVLNLNRPPLLPFLIVNSRVVMVTATISCSAVIGLLFSKFEPENLSVVVFSIFALAMAALAYLVPIVPVSNMLRACQSAELDRIERLIEAHVRRLAGEPPRADGPGADEKLPPLDELVKARDLVAAVRTLPPGGQISVSAAAFVTFLSFLPTLLDYARDYFSG